LGPPLGFDEHGNGDFKDELSGNASGARSPMNGAESAENAALRHNLLAELDARQDEVLAALAALNDQIEAVLKQAIPQDKLAEPVEAIEPKVEEIRPLKKAA
jgi:hypothetical protein